MTLGNTSPSMNRLCVWPARNGPSSPQNWRRRIVVWPASAPDAEEVELELRLELPLRGRHVRVQAEARLPHPEEGLAVLAASGVVSSRGAVDRDLGRAQSLLPVGVGGIEVVDRIGLRRPVQLDPGLVRIGRVGGGLRVRRDDHRTEDRGGRWLGCRRFRHWRLHCLHASRGWYLGFLRSSRGPGRGWRRGRGGLGLLGFQGLDAFLQRLDRLHRRLELGFQIAQLVGLTRRRKRRRQRSGQNQLLH